MLFQCADNKDSCYDMTHSFVYALLYQHILYVYIYIYIYIINISL